MTPTSSRSRSSQSSMDFGLPFRTRKTIVEVYGELSCSNSSAKPSSISPASATAHPPPVPASPHPPPGRLPPQVPACRNLRATGSPSHPALPAPSSVPQTVHCTIHTVPCALNLPLHGQFLLGLAALYHKRILVVTAVSVSQCCLVICVEKILLAKCLDLLIDPV